MKVREAAVAGLFYEADAQHLQQHIAKLMGGVQQNITPPPQALIVPHAGYIYSGQTAARAYRLLQPLRDQIRRVVLFGPAHRVYLQGMAVPSVDAFSTPLGRVRLDRESLQELTALPGVSVCDEAHREEHSLEVQLPFLQSVLTDFTLVPVVVGYCDTPTVSAAIDRLWGGPETMVVISTDLSHFHSDIQARGLDNRTCERLVAKDNTLVGAEACGAFALNGLMSTGHGADLRVELLDMCNSGDTAGSRERVVGYGAFALY